MERKQRRGNANKQGSRRSYPGRRKLPESWEKVVASDGQYFN
ncbi:hypothetical protein ALC62_14405 [Cyphomyrmex costatus]|uniref:Uncharacterized protein n=1 Tax=Cyphomyrmex costatus TaxID=456900 RepID=A0A195C2J4_9HYME|nr:hypothetical protein ALC62_14405 [Cyphomyrmex costatus]